MMGELLAVVVKKRQPEAIKERLQSFGEGKLSWITIGERLACLLAVGQSKKYLAKLVLELLWLTEDRRLLSWAANDFFTLDNRWEKQKWQQSVRKRGLAEQEKLLNAVRCDLRALSWQQPVLDIAGFATFATPSLRRQMMALGREEWEVLAEEKERRAFAEVLQSFIQMQEPMTAIANVLWQNGDFIIFDEKGRDLKKIYEAALLLERQELDEATGEDLLLGILITVVPKRLILHGERSRAEADLAMVEMVFADRLKWCGGCAFCRRANFEG